MFIIKHTLTGLALATTIVSGVFGAPAHTGQLENRDVTTRYVTQWFNRTSTVSGIYAFRTGTGMIPPGVAPTRTGTGYSDPTGHVGYNHTVGVAPVKGSIPTGYVRYNGTVGVAPVKGNVTTVVSTVYVVPTSNGSMTTYEASPTKAELHASVRTTNGVKHIGTFDEEAYGVANPDLWGKRGKRETVEEALSASRAAQLSRHTTATRYFGFAAHTMIWRGVEPTHTPTVYQPSIDQPSIGKLVDAEVVAKLATFPHNGGDLDDEAFAKVIQDAENNVQRARQGRPIAPRDIEDLSEEDLIEFLDYLDLLGLIPADRGLEKRDESLTGNVTPLKTLKQTVEEALNNVSKDFPGLPKDLFETHYDRPRPYVDADVEVPAYNTPGAVNPTPVQGAVERKSAVATNLGDAGLKDDCGEFFCHNWDNTGITPPGAAIEKRQVHEVGTAPQHNKSTGSVNYNASVGEALEHATGTAPKVDMKIPANLPLPTLAPQVPWLTADLLREWLAHRHPKRSGSDVDAVEVIGQPLEVAKRDPGIRLGENKMFKNLKPGDIATPINGKRGRIFGEKDILKKIKPGMDATTSTTLIKVRAIGVKAN